MSGRARHAPARVLPSAEVPGDSFGQGGPGGRAQRMLQFAKFVATRAGMAVFTLMMVSFIVFTLMEMVPGDCAERYLAFKNTQGSQISIADIESERIRLGLDKPFVLRWVNWLGNASSAATSAIAASCAQYQSVVGRQVPDLPWHLPDRPVPRLHDCDSGGHHRGHGRRVRC